MKHVASIAFQATRQRLLLKSIHPAFARRSVPPRPLKRHSYPRGRIWVTPSSPSGFLRHLPFRSPESASACWRNPPQEGERDHTAASGPPCMATANLRCSTAPEDWQTIRNLRWSTTPEDRLKENSARQTKLLQQASHSIFKTTCLVGTHNTHDRNTKHHMWQCAKSWLNAWTCFGKSPRYRADADVQVRAMGCCFQPLCSSLKCPKYTADCPKCVKVNR